MERQEYDKALKQYQIVSDSDPENLNARVKMALILIEQKNFRTAISTLREILALAPESDRIRFYLAAVYEELKEYPDAVEQFLQIPTASSFYEEAMVHAAYLHKIQGNIPKAIALLETGIQKRKDISQFFALYAAFLDELKEHKRAAALLEKAVVEFPGNEQLHFFLGSIHDKLGDRQSTITSMRKVISLNENHAQALNYLAYTLAEMDKDLTEAENLAKRAVKIKTDDAYIRDTLGWVYYKQGKFSEAVRELEEAHKMKSSESVIAEHLGDAYFSIDLAQRARDMYELAIRTETEPSTIEKIEAKIRAIERAQNMKGRLPASFSKDESRSH
jgi:tetratricopeptide (TPR) repeat protein